jgi:hypothetical protein
MTDVPERPQCHQPTPFEERALEKMLRAELEHPVPRYSVRKKEDGGVLVSSQHPDEKIATAAQAAAFGTTHTDFVDAILSQVLNVTGVDEKAFNALVKGIAGIHPRDHVEAMLATQMATIHVATMDQARRLMHCTSVEARDMAERALNRLARTFAAQTEALKKYRSTADQRITVTHVNVGDGGQAIVGNVTGGGRAAEKEETTP